MKAEKIIKTTESIELDIEEVTLLSVEEAQIVPKNVRAIGSFWWLRSPGYIDYIAAYVHLRWLRLRQRRLRVP